MSGETPFRIALVVLILVTMPIGVYFRLRAASGEKISHKDEGYLFAAVLRLTGLVFWIGLFGYLLFPDYFRWAQLPLPTWLRWLGLVIGLLCPLLLFWTFSSLGKNLTDTVVTRTNATLVTHGPYRFVRHPFYVTAALLLASVTLLSASGWLGVCGVVILALLTMRTPKEEQMLIERFGEKYREYMARTGRYFPRIGW